MNNTKKVLIILAIIFSVADAGWGIYDIVRDLSMPAENAPALFDIIFAFISVAISLAIAVLLILAIWGNGKYFRQRYSLYMTALMIELIINLLSVTAILLVVSMFVSDHVWLKPQDDIRYHKPDYEIKSREEQIAELRHKKEHGEISEEQFQEEIMKLL